MAAQPLSANALFSDANLVSYWKYDETSGTSAADSKGSNTGTASSSAILNNAGKFSNAAVFVKASSHKITHGDIFPLNAYTDMTFVFWYKTSSSGVDDSVISNYAQSSGGGGYSIDLRSDNKIKLDTWNTSGGNTGSVASGVTVNDGTYHHIAIVKTGSTAIVYVDGVAGSSGSVTAITPSSAGNFHVGGEPNIYGYSDCSIDDLAIFSRALTEAEINSLAIGIVDKSVNDTGSGSDAKSISVSQTRTDTGTGTDAKSINVTIPTRADTGAGVDAKSISLSQTRADTGTGTEATSISATLPARADTGTGGDAAVVQNTISSSDNGVGSDVTAIMAAITRADTGSATEALAILAAIAVADTGSGSEQAALSAYVSVSDTVTASDAVAVLAAIARSDSGIATDAVAVMAQIAVSDSGVASEALALLVKMSLSETGAGANTVAILAHVGVSDSGGAVEALAAAFFIAVQDSTPHGVDALSFLVSPSVSESVSGSDAVLAVEIFRKMLNDAGQGSDAITSELIRFTISEAGAGADLVSLVKRIYPYIKRPSPYTKIKP